MNSRKLLRTVSRESAFAKSLDRVALHEFVAVASHHVLRMETKLDKKILWVFGDSCG
jgi:hypothetical protein